MSTRKSLLIGVSALALAVAAAAAVRADQNFTANHTASATAGGNVSDQVDNSNKNENIGDAFKDAEGVISEVQNNGDNAAITNGNTVDAKINTGVATGNVDYDAISTQTATQSGGSTATETNVDDDNVIAGDAFQNAKGVFSKVQNNGANSALNNGNAVAAAILEGGTNTTTLKAESVQTATVNGGTSPDNNSYTADGVSTNDNDITSNAFQNTEGVASALQNNGPNSAANNGNTVAAVIQPGSTINGNRTFDTDSRQRATVNGSNESIEGSNQGASNTDTNRIRSQAFQNTEGVGSVMQNNGANSALNNGNTVSAVVTDNGSVNGNNNFDTNQSANFTSQQTARVDAGADGANSSTQTGSSDSNSITNQAFEQAEGVFSVLQNNGPNSALNNGNTVSAIITNDDVANGSSTFDTDSQQTAVVDSDAGGSITSAETDSADTNTINGDAFRDSEGIVSALQNNGANSAANNGNTVSAVIANGGVGQERALFDTTSAQSATVQARAEGEITNSENPSPNTNTIAGDAFASGEGVMSALQNNGANSALNNGNTVSAIITNSTTNTASNDQLETASTQTAQVLAGTGGTGGEITDTQIGSDDTNTLSGAAFDASEGIMSSLQNNGANSAANNGNTVSAIVANGSISGAGGTLRTASTQTARVDSNALSLIRSDGPPAAPNPFSPASDDTNTISSTAFQDAKGVGSALQNNGANSALNNGNTVSAFVTDSSVSFANGVTAALRSPFGALTTTQSATVEANESSSGLDGIISVEQRNGSLDTNTITSEAFENAQGVFSALQNNGANSALNNGNTVSAIIADTTVGTATADFDTTSTQTATVTASSSNINGGVNSSQQNPTSSDLNTITSEAFRAAKGVMSVGQNNGANTAANNGNTVAAIITDGNVNTTSTDTLDATSTQTATVQTLKGTNPADGNKNVEGQNGPDSNTISGDAFSSAQGVGSVLQNNGANSALNNGNTVSAVITDGTIGSRANFNADSRQVARVFAGDNSRNLDDQATQASPENNSISSDAFQESEGVFSALQNNGANSALNNGNTVAAFIADGGGTTVNLEASSLLDANKNGGFNSTQSAAVDADAANSANDARPRTGDQDQSNSIGSNAFRDAEGVFSALQNNGGNSALNNGNTVAAVIAQNNIGGNQNSTFNADSTQTARVDANSGNNNSLRSPAADATNTLNGDAFRNGEGVFSVLQNNGGNVAGNNGNVVSAFIADGNVDVNGINTFNTDSTQNARVDSTVLNGNTSTEQGGDDTNRISSAAFSNTQGVVSVLQNNGPNSAINNGNTVAAIINDCTTCTGTFNFTSTSAQTSVVVAGSSMATHAGGSDNTNSISGTAFSNVSGVYSITQNNAPNSAISNGNTVSAVIANN